MSNRLVLSCIAVLFTRKWIWGNLLCVWYGATSVFLRLESDCIIEGCFVSLVALTTSASRCKRSFGSNTKWKGTYSCYPGFEGGMWQRPKQRQDQVATTDQDKDQDQVELPQVSSMRERKEIIYPLHVQDNVVTDDIWPFDCHQP